MTISATNHYDTLGLDRDCSAADIRMAYRALAKMHHPDVNSASPDAMARIQVLNDAYEILGDETRRRAYDEELALADKDASKKFRRSVAVNISTVVQISVLDFLRGTTLNVNVKDPANPGGMETYELEIPPDTAPGTRFRLKRVAPFSSGHVLVRVKARPDHRFKTRGSDLRCDMRINARRATSGGSETIRGATGNSISVKIPPNVARGEILRIAGEGLPKPRGGRGDLLVRIMYRPEVNVSRGAARKSTPRLLS